MDTRNKPIQTLAVVLVTGILFVRPVLADVDNGTSIACPAVSGHIPGAVVPTAQAAKDIYLAVLHARFPDISYSQDELTVLDEGATWNVSPTTKPIIKSVKDHKGHIQQQTTVVQGGGTLEMSIDKCTGRVRMHFSR